MSNVKRKDTCLIVTKSMHNNLYWLIFKLYSSMSTIKSHSTYIYTVEHEIFEYEILEYENVEM